MRKLFIEIGIPFTAFIIFFVFQSMGSLSELKLTIFVCVVAIGTLLVHYYPGEALLFLIGLGFGVIIEIGLRYFGYQQVWRDASLFGVPYWLPLIWGLGFIIITRLGIAVRGIRT